MPPIKIVAGRVSTHAHAMAVMVFLRRLLTPPEATIVPAIPDDNTWVVLTGKPNEELTPMVAAAQISALAPWA